MLSVPIAESARKALASFGQVEQARKCLEDLASNSVAAQCERMIRDLANPLASLDLRTALGIGTIESAGAALKRCIGVIDNTWLEEHKSAAAQLLRAHAANESIAAQLRRSIGTYDYIQSLTCTTDQIAIEAARTWRAHCNMIGNINIDQILQGQRHAANLMSAMPTVETETHRIFEELARTQSLIEGTSLDAIVIREPAPREQILISTPLYVTPPERIVSRIAVAPHILTRDAFGLIVFLEQKLRAYIDEILTNAFGPEWPEHVLDVGMLKRWKSKSISDKRGTTNRRLIDSADFADYKDVILSEKAWEFFRSDFVRRSLVEETFARLRPYRNDGAHSISLGKSDLSRIHYEVTIFLECIRVSLDADLVPAWLQ